MNSFRASQSDFRILCPEVLWIEPEFFEQARVLSRSSLNEVDRWQNYLDVLAMFSLGQWLEQRLQIQPLVHKFDASSSVCSLKVGAFKLGVVATETVLDETIYIPKAAVDQPELAAHFYVAIEIAEEQEEAIVRGFLSHSQLVDFDHPIKTHLNRDCYSIQMDQFDSEPNHLLTYCQHLEPSAVPLPKLFTQTIQNALTATQTKLSDWLQDLFDGSWQAIETLIHPETQMMLSTRGADSNAQRAKIIDLGMQLNQQTVAAVITIIPKPEEKLESLVQIHPTRNNKFLPADVKLRIISATGKVLQEVTSRTQDSYIQSKPFRGKIGQRFSVEVSLHDQCVREDFEF